ncbi:MAG: hypothetical protein J6C23_08560 [Clostridia bacterium]|nr:hypothetical protein [Clostridia bacterium]
MSCEDDDDYGWDDYVYEPIITVQNIKVSINTISKNDVKTIEEALTLCLDMKLDKLNVILKNMNVYNVGDCLIVNDRYRISPNLIDIVNGFGMKIKPIKIEGMRGNTYIIGDIVTGLLKISGVSYDYTKNLSILQQAVNIDNKQLFSDLSNRYLSDLELVSFIREIKREGFVSIDGKETFVDNESQGVESDRYRVEEKLQKFLSDIRRETCQIKKHVQNGTIELLADRAKKMGYTVQKKQVDKQIQLVLVRND